MKVVTISHDVNGIRMNVDGVTHHWSNQSWLAEAHAQAMVRKDWLEAKIKDIRTVIDRADDTNLRPSLESILLILNRE